MRSFFLLKESSLFLGEPLWTRSKTRPGIASRHYSGRLPFLWHVFLVKHVVDALGKDWLMQAEGVSRSFFQGSLGYKLLSSIRCFGH